jgi:hypothetical protein
VQNVKVLKVDEENGLVVLHGKSVFAVSEAGSLCS